MISLEPGEEKKMIETIRRESIKKYVQHLITNGGGTVMLSTAQAAGYLNVTSQTLRKLEIPSYDVTGKGGAVSYKIADLDAYLEGKKVE